MVDDGWVGGVALLVSLPGHIFLLLSAYDTFSSLNQKCF